MGSFWPILDFTFLIVAVGAFWLGNLWHGRRLGHILAAQQLRVDYQQFIDSLSPPGKVTS